MKDELSEIWLYITEDTILYTAEECGFKSCLVLSGNTKSNIINLYSIQPYFIIDDINSINDII